MNILLTFTGFHDPYAKDLVSGVEQTGPILTLVSEKHFDIVYVFSTPQMSKITQETNIALGQRHPDIKVDIIDFQIDDPTDYSQIITGLRSHFQKISETHETSQFFVATASGTPQMHVCWALLTASGEIPARVLHTRPPRFVTDKMPIVTEVDFADKDFPVIRAKSIASIDIDLENDGINPYALIESIGIIGDHPQFNKCLETAVLLSQTDLPVFILGESGVGKELIARLIHQLSNRGKKGEKLVTVNCGAIPETLAESTLFGCVKGAFTGSTANRKGRFRMADKGTLFLDEIGDLPVQIQIKILRALQDGDIQPVGTDDSHEVDVRIIAATNKEIDKAIEQREFRDDLYFRLQAGEFRIPPLRERKTDIPKLAAHFLDNANKMLRKQKRFTPETMSTFMSYSWPGNVRELENTVNRVVVLTRGVEIKPESLPMNILKNMDYSKGIPEPHDGFKIDEYQKKIRRELFEKAIVLSNGNKSQAARLLGVTPQAVSKFVKGTEFRL